MLAAVRLENRTATATQALAVLKQAVFHLHIVRHASAEMHCIAAAGGLLGGTAPKLRERERRGGADQRNGQE